MMHDCSDCRDQTCTRVAQEWLSVLVRLRDEVGVITQIGDSTLALDLIDGSTLRIDLTRYPTDPHDRG